MIKFAIGLLMVFGSFVMLVIETIMIIGGYPANMPGLIALVIIMAVGVMLQGLGMESFTKIMNGGK